MYTLYYSSGSCSSAVRILLNELNVPYEAKSAWTDSTKTTKDPEFLKVNPRGTVPALVDNGMLIREGASIIIYLTDIHRTPLLPTAQPARAKALEWLMFCNSTLHPAYSKVFWTKKTKMDEASRAQLVEATNIQIQTLWNDVEENLKDHDYLAGNEITIADILLTVIANWSTALPTPIKFGPKTRKLLETVSTQPTSKL